VEDIDLGLLRFIAIVYWQLLKRVGFGSSKLPNTHYTTVFPETLYYYSAFEVSNRFKYQTMGVAGTVTKVTTTSLMKAAHILNYIC
jgi:hypothetical protein